jgi:hypothetical protein
MNFNFWQNLHFKFFLGHRQLGYYLFFTKLCLKPLLHLHHHVGKLHLTSMNWEGPLNIINRSSTSSISNKINFQLDVQGLMAIQMVDLVMIKHVALMFSWYATPSPCKVVFHQISSMALRSIPPCVQSWHKYPKIRPSLQWFK